VHRVDAAAVASYLEVLDRAMADLRLDDDERGELAEFAAAVGLHETERAQAHRRWVLDMADAARADGVVDGDEYDQLLRAAHGLGVDIGVVDAAVRGERQQRVRVELRPGTRVCFTGEATDASGQLIEREVLERAARDVGLVAEEKMTKSRCDLLVTAEFGSASTKMDQARNWAKPVTDVASFLGALDALRRSVPTRVDAVVDGAVRRVGTCVHCGAPFTYDGKARAVPVCATCTTTPAVGVERIVSDSLPIVQRSAGEAPTMETLLCSVCGRTFTRARTRGRKPTRCPNC
jgi:DNA polymerase-3 subunit epsilon